MTGFMGLTFSAFAGICFVSGLAVLMGGKEHHSWMALEILYP